MELLSPEEERVHESFRRAGLHVKRPWLKQATTALPSRELEIALYELSLYSDFRIMGAGCLPHDIGSCERRVIEDRLVLQIDELVNIGESADYRQEDTRNRVLKILLTDGVHSLAGIELKTIRDLSVNSQAGVKVVVQNFEVRRGIALFTPDNLRVLGGMVPELEKARLDRLEKIASAKKRRQLIPDAVAADESQNGSAQPSRQLAQPADRPPEHHQRVSNDEIHQVEQQAQVGRHDQRLREFDAPPVQHVMEDVQRQEPLRAQNRLEPLPRGPECSRQPTAERDSLPCHGPLPGLSAMVMRAPTMPNDRRIPNPTAPADPIPAVADDDDVIEVVSGDGEVSDPSGNQRPRPARRSGSHRQEGASAQPFEYIVDLARDAASGASPPRTARIKAAVMGVFGFKWDGGFSLTLSVQDGTGAAHVAVGDGLLAPIIGVTSDDYVRLGKKERKALNTRMSAKLSHLEALVTVETAPSGGACSPEGGAAQAATAAPLALTALAIDERCSGVAHALLSRVQRACA